MTVIALGFSVFVAALGLLGLASPSLILRFSEPFQTPAGLYLAAALRLIMGAALFFAAPESRAPEALRVLGVIIIVAGVITLLFGPERFHRLLDWWSARGSGFKRAWAAVALALGLFLMYALVA